MTKSSANSGVHTSSGIEFQKHCALYVLFDKYSVLEDRKYFICLEHHDDFLFCLQTEKEVLSSISAYQAKKSGTTWGMGEVLSEILDKITQTGLDLTADPHPKEKSYSHSLHFITNEAISLHCGASRIKDRTTQAIDPSNLEIEYQNLDPAIKANITKGLAKATVTDATQLGELDKVSLIYIDFPKTPKAQKLYLIGQFTDIFGSKVNDHAAAVEALLTLFRNVEVTLNNGNRAKLLDKSKRVTSDQITNAMRIITSKTKAFDLWRERGNDLASQIKISVFDKERFRLSLQNSIDLFKDKKQAAHRKIQKYVTDNQSRFSHHVDEISCIVDIYETYVKEKRNSLSELDTKAAIAAAFIELNG